MLKIISVLLIVLFSITVNAQQQQRRSNNSMRPDGWGQGERPAPEELANKQSEFMKKELKLTEDQFIKIKAINTKYHIQLEEQRKNSPDMTDYDKAMLAKIKNDQNEELRKVLTTDQWEVYKLKMEERKR